MERYQSRTLWLIVLVISLATGLCIGGKVTGGEWQTTVLASFGAWQLRRYGDNRLAAENEGGKNVVFDDH